MRGSGLKQPYIGVDDCGNQLPPEDHHEDDVGVLHGVAAVLVLLHLGFQQIGEEEGKLENFLEDLRQGEEL